MSQEWEESLIAVVQDSYLDILNELMNKYSVVCDDRRGYRDDSEDVFHLNKLDSYNARRLKTLYLSVFEYYVNRVDPSISRIERGIYPCLCIKYGDLSYVLEKNPSTVVCIKLDDDAVNLIDNGRVINMKDVQEYYDSKDLASNNKQFKKKKNN